MSSEWGKKKLGDIFTLQRGHDLPSQERKVGQIPVMGSSGVTGYHDQYKAKGPGVIIGRSGNSMGQISYVSGNYWPLNTSLYITDFKGHSPEFLYYFLKQINFDQFNSGSAQKSLNRNAVYPFEVSFPSRYETQSAIASFLFSLENKIEVNQRVNQTLEQMAQALFKSWFVDFEPVKAKIAALEAGGSQEDATRAAMTAISGKDTDALAVFEREHPEHYAELKATAELFPSAMQESELGGIPEGWCYGPLSDIATFANGKVDISSLTPDTYISTENMLENRAGISTASSLPSVNSVPDFRCGHVLISNIRPYFKKIWLARFEGGRSADVLAFEARDSIAVEYIYNLLYQESFFDFMMLTSKGVKMPRGDKKAIMDWQCICPEKKITHAFSKAVGKYYSFIESNNVQNKTLTQLRDTLLPKLLSGEITLPEAEQAVSEAENV
ncbi:restriction endonuclease [Pectobacterium brasiliense]|uniref:restriction endonuclease subunit S n=1 Tax=Pectobacterium TaxID=122277 RepID=UPI000583F6E9|nr:MULTISPECIES: restriction endonuclease subunit S [Pectobacterium]KHT03962.1 restriction endonuclease [Pectobacterium brasiliense]UPY96035.1 restriction endonuclease subunit S [Pectobacterium sp. 21LCBS03]